MIKMFSEHSNELVEEDALAHAQVEERNGLHKSQTKIYNITSLSKWYMMPYL